MRLLAAALAVASLTCVACGGTVHRAKRVRPTLQTFASRPDLQPTRIEIRTPTQGTAPGYIFIAPKQQQGGPAGLMIMDDAGHVVWYEPLKAPTVATDFRVQRYHGRSVLTWWEGTTPYLGIGVGRYVIADHSYRRIATVRAGHGLRGDLHEFQLTPRGTAYVTAYKAVPYDLSPYGGRRHSYIWDGVAQEIDIASGRVVWEWHSLKHVPPTESEALATASKATKKAPLDYFHINAVSDDGDGNVLISARNTSAVYEVRKRDGAILWRLGGTKTDFAMGPGTNFAWQHDARREADGTLTIFDNSALPKRAPYSRALVLRLDTSAHTATLVKAYSHPAKLLSPHQGDVQVLPNGDFFVGWGGAPYFTEFAPDGMVVFDAKVDLGDTYRAYRFPWTGHPVERPALVAREVDSHVVVYASWNGATDVAHWYVIAGRKRARLHLVTRAPKAGFETRISLPGDPPFVQVKAVDVSGAVLGTSRIVQP